MNCSRHFLGHDFEHHDWQRRVTHAVSLSEPVTDQWGRKYESSHALCHTEYVCRRCGAVRDEGECTCERERAESCPIRLDWLAQR